MRLLRNLIFLLLILSPQIAYPLDSDRDAPLNVTSDHFAIDLKKHTTTYEGNVVATQGTTTLTGDKLILYTDKNNQLEKGVAFGDLATYRTLPAPDKTELYAEAHEIEYYPDKQLIVLIKNAKVIQAENTYLGPKILYNMEKETVTSPPSHDGRATIIIEPKAKTP